MSTWTCVSTTKIAHATIAIERILIVAGVKKGALIFIDPPQCARLEENDVNNSVRRRCVEGAADKPLLQSLVIEFRWADNPDQLRKLATELVLSNVDLIFGTSSTKVGAARQATTIIPIVFATHADPVGTFRRWQRDTILE
jgi:hypothetical protein